MSTLPYTSIFPTTATFDPMVLWNYYFTKQGGDPWFADTITLEDYNSRSSRPVPKGNFGTPRKDTSVDVHPGLSSHRPEPPVQSLVSTVQSLWFILWLRTFYPYHLLRVRRGQTETPGQDRVYSL